MYGKLGGCPESGTVRCPHHVDREFVHGPDELSNLRGPTEHEVRAAEQGSDLFHPKSFLDVIGDVENPCMGTPEDQQRGGVRLYQEARIVSHQVWHISHSVRQHEPGVARTVCLGTIHARDKPDTGVYLRCPVNEVKRSPQPFERFACERAADVAGLFFVRFLVHVSGEELRVCDNLDPSGFFQHPFQSAGVVVVAVADDHPMQSLEAYLQGLEVHGQGCALPGVKQESSPVSFNEHTEPVLPDETGTADTVIGQDG